MNKILLPHDGTEYAHFFFNSLPDGDIVLEAQIGDGGAWTGLDTSGAVPRLLLRGPDAPAGPGVLVAVDSSIRVRVKDSPEVIVRGAGYVALVS